MPNPGISCALIVLVAIGAGLRLLQYIADPALSLDEIAVARNVLERNLWDLLMAPLAYDQTAPKGFLLATKIATSVFGSSDYGLRLFPLVCSLAALIGLWRVAVRIFDGTGALVAVALFAAAVPVISYAAVVKPYSADVAASVLMLWLALYLGPNAITRRRALWAGVGGAVAVWFSQPAVFVLAGLSAALVWSHWRHSLKSGVRTWTLLAPTVILWGIAAGAAVVVGLSSMTPATHEYMRQYWAAGFMPSPLIKAVVTFWPWKPLMELIGSEAEGLSYPIPALYIICMLLGFWQLLRRRSNAALLILAPMAVTLGAAVFRQYPFSDRLVLFLIPTVIFGIAAAIEWIGRSTAAHSTVLTGLAVGAAVAPALYGIVQTPPVYQVENIKPVLSHLQAKRKPGDDVYVYYGAAPAVRFYDDDYELLESDYVLGACHRGSNRLYLEELDRFRGSKRLWVVMTHAFPPYRERDDILRYLDAIGSRREALVVEAHTIGTGSGLPAEIFLYDLSEPHRLKQALASSFQITGPSGAHPRFTCSAGPQARMLKPALSKVLP